MKIGILRETKLPYDTRVPLTPGQCRLVEEKYPNLKLYVQPSPFRCFSDTAYAREGIRLTDDLSDCDIIFGVKEVVPEQLIPMKTYIFFSHTIKKQEHNKKLLQVILDKGIRLIDYEVLTDNQGIRIIGFGRWAGIIGTYLGIRAYSIRNGLSPVPPLHEAGSLAEMIRIARVYRLPAFKIVITGDGRVGNGAREMMDAFRIRRVAIADFLESSFKVPVYTQLNPGDYNNTKDGSPFIISHFFLHPEKYIGNFQRFCNNTDLLIAAAYWDPAAPVLFTRQQIASDGFRINVIADISCDLNGSVPSTIKTATLSTPYYDYNYVSGMAEPPFSDPSNITVMAVDNLPCGLPVDSSFDFGQALTGKILPLLISGDTDGIIQNGTITSDGQLTKRFEYLQDWVAQTKY
jgi:saccharopine dehydrogenase (NAD+, L-lysine-forming)